MKKILILGVMTCLIIVAVYYFTSKQNQYAVFSESNTIDIKKIVPKGPETNGWCRDNGNQFNHLGERKKFSDLRKTFNISCKSSKDCYAIKIHPEERCYEEYYIALNSESAKKAKTLISTSPKEFFNYCNGLDYSLGTLPSIDECDQGYGNDTPLPTGLACINQQCTLVKK